MEIHQWIGWLGAVTYLAAYFLLVLGKVSSDKSLYHIMNVIGAICLVINAYNLSDPPTMTLNAIWGGIAIFALGNLMFYKKQVESKENRN